MRGGFAIPEFLKEYRKQKQYLLVGMPLNRDSERMVMSDIVYAATEPKSWILNKNPTDKEKRFRGKMGLEILDAGVEDLLDAAGFSPPYKNGEERRPCPRHEGGKARGCGAPPVNFVALWRACVA